MRYGNSNEKPSYLCSIVPVTLAYYLPRYSKAEHSHTRYVEVSNTHRFTLRITAIPAVVMK